MSRLYDVAVLGAGPSGLCAALRLRQMGRTVVVLERAEAPLSNIGALLSPGVRGLLAFLGLPELLAQSGGRAIVEHHTRWSDNAALRTQVPSSQAGIMVQRALFDGLLLDAAMASGAEVQRPCKVESLVRQGERWRVNYHCQGERRSVGAHFIVDARGRALSAATRVPLAPPLLALRQDYHDAGAEGEVRIEALASGWLWGAATAPGGYRILAFCDPVAMRGVKLAPSRQRPAALLHQMVSDSGLFAHLASATALSSGAYDATPFLASDWWGERMIKVGDAALALDPLSSSGVEKGMRFALQTALVINTVLSNPSAARLAQEFLRSKMHDTCARHLAWTQHQYAEAWCTANSPFWTARSAAYRLERMPAQDRDAIDVCRALAWAELDDMRSHSGDWPSNPLHLLDAPALADEVAIIDVACCVGDAIESRRAVRHPNLSTPVVFVHGRELVPLLGALSGSRSFAELVERWSTRMAAHEAIAICAWALRNGLLTSTQNKGAI